MVLPKTSATTPAGILKKMPVMVEMATQKPMASGSGAQGGGKQRQDGGAGQGV